MPGLMDSGKFYFFAFVLLLIGQRLIEMLMSRNNESVLYKQGGFEIGLTNFRLMKAMHVLFFCSLVIEGLTQFRVPPPAVLFTCLAAVMAGQLLRVYSMFTLRERWTATVVALPGSKPVRSGIFRYFNHPNYVGVILEILAVPLMAGLYRTAILFSCLNLCVLFFRIKNEAQALGPELVQQ